MAAKDYANSRRTFSGSYTKSFPSIHLTQDLMSNLKARVSWSNSPGGLDIARSSELFREDVPVELVIPETKTRASGQGCQ